MPYLPVIASTSVSVSAINVANLLGIAMLTNANPIRQVSPSNLRETSIDKASFELIKRNSENPTNGTNSMEGSGIEEDLITAIQLECAERLGVDLSECNTHGVFTNRTSPIDEIILDHVNLVTNTTDYSWNNVTQTALNELLYLDLHSKNLDHIEGNDFDGLDCLSGLSISNNSISTLQNGIFDRLPKLNRLDAHSNQIRSLEGNIFEKNPKLRWLNLNINELLSIPQELFKNSKILQHLLLQINQLTTLTDGTLSNTQSLESLYIDHNLLEKLPEEDLKNATSLEILSIINTPIKMSIELFRKLQERHIRLCFKTQNQEKQAYIKIDNTTIPINDISEFFNLVENEQHGCIYTDQFILPNNKSDLTELKKIFLCNQLEPINIDCTTPNNTHPTIIDTTKPTDTDITEVTEQSVKDKVFDFIPAISIIGGTIIGVALILWCVPYKGRSILKKHQKN